MESAATAQVCTLHGVPFVPLKDISNNEDHAATATEGFADFPTTAVGQRATALLLRVVERVGGRQ